MNAVRKHVNSTGRKKIDRKCVSVRMLESKEGKPLTAKIIVDLSGEKFPAHAKVLLEAYYRSSSMRFDFGTVESFKSNQTVVLSEIDRGTVPLFRLKIVDAGEETGKILGAALGIQPNNEAELDGKRSLFPVDYCDLGEEVWKVQIGDGNKPRLLLSNRVQSISLKLRDNPLFQGLVLPAALRRVIEELAFKPEADDEEEIGWREEWLQYCKETLSIQVDPANLDEDGKQGWVDDVVGKFCGSYRFIQSIKKMETEAVRS